MMQYGSNCGNREREPRCGPGAWRISAGAERGSEGAKAELTAPFDFFSQAAIVLSGSCVTDAGLIWL